MSTPPPPDARAAADRIASLAGRSASVGVVLGSGLGGFAALLEGAVTVAYGEVPGFRAPTVAGHAGAVVVGRCRGVPVVCLSGRTHLYEGRPPAEVVHGVRTLAALGVRTVLLTNAAGGIAPGLTPGDLLLVTDHLNLTGTSPLEGPGYAFVDMSAAYDREVAGAARAEALTAGITLKEGVYAGLRGPSYETPAEIRMLASLGAAAVGMSTVLEVIALRALGVRVGALSCITNLAAGLGPGTLDHAEVQATAGARRGALEALLAGWIERVARP